MKYSRIGFLLLFVSFSSGCANDTTEGLNIKSTNEMNQTIKISENVTNPISHVAKILGIDLNDMARTDIINDGYNMVARMPIIEKAKKSPFMLQQWATNISDVIQDSTDKSSITNTIKCMYSTINGTTKEDPRDLSPQEGDGDLIDAYRYLCSLYEKVVDSDVERLIHNSILTTNFKKKLGQFIFSFADATILCKSAFSKLDKDEYEFLINRPERYFFPNNEHFDFMTGPTNTQYKIVNICRKIDFESLFEASILLSTAIDMFSEYLLTAEEPFIEPESETEEVKVPLFLPSPVGDIIILGPIDNQFVGNGAIVIDLGGNDQYLGQISSGHLAPGKIQVSIDRAGDDTYDTRNDRYGQGSGCLSIGILNDLSGNDIYLAGDLAQGVGLYGVGFLFDREGDDYYRMNVLGQGFGTFGMGGLIDNEGNDRYLINSLGQGAGSTMGIGLLCDKKGRDKYIAKREKTRGLLLPSELWSHVQGAGLSIRSHKWTRQPSFYGGIGIISDGEGDDFYYAEKGNCMGSSYFMSIGVLADHSGNDKYIPKNGYGISSAVHWTASAFIDKAGNDTYYGATQTGGVASDRSVAIMADYEGNDIYGPTPESLKELIKQEHADEKKPIDDKTIDLLVNNRLADVSFGAAKKPNAIGVLIDYKGDDWYYAKKSGWGESCGGVMPPLEPRHWGHALLLDLNGNDFYNTPGRKNNHYHLYYNHGICYDTDYSGTKIEAVNPYQKEDSKSATLGENTNLTMSKLYELRKYSIFRLFSEYGRLVHSGEKAIDEIISYLLNSNDNEINRGLTEVLVELTVKSNMLPSIAHKIESLLFAKDPYLRRFSARLLGWWISADSKTAILDSLKHADAMDRSSLIWALGKVDQMGDSTDIVAEYALSDPIYANRLEALLVLIKYSEKNFELRKYPSKRTMETLLELIDDSDSIISAYAAKGLEFYGDSLDVIDLLKQKMSSLDPYVKRFSAQSLIRNGVIEAIPVLIETLKFPSIDTFKHYDHDIAKELSFYCGVDFPEENRYEYETWHDWWADYGATVDLDRNLKIMREIEKAHGTQNIEEGIRIFENLFSANPDNQVITKRYIYFCNHWITYNWLTLPLISKDIIAKCVRVQKIMVRLDPENNEFRVRLAFFENWLENFNDP